jgi:hypothetical protein
LSRWGRQWLKPTGYQSDKPTELGWKNHLFSYLFTFIDTLQIVSGLDKDLDALICVPISPLFTNAVDFQVSVSALYSALIGKTFERLVS